MHFRITLNFIPIPIAIRENLRQKKKFRDPLVFKLKVILKLQSNAHHGDKLGDQEEITALGELFLPHLY